MAAPKGFLTSWPHNKKFVVVVSIWQVLMIVLYGVKARYDPAAAAHATIGKEFEETRKHHFEQTNDVNYYYGLFQDVHIMVFIGFGFLMTFLRRYGYSAVGLNFLLASLAIEFAFLIKASFEHDFYAHVKDLVTSDFVAATILISFGAVLGKTSPLQLVIMVIIEVVFVVLNEWIATHFYKGIDVGGSMFIHAFGAYFGLAVARVLWNPGHHENPKESAGYNSNLFAMIGTVFLWICWPSFNGALAPGDDRHRAVVNTYLSLVASCIAAFVVSYAVSADKKLDMVHIQNATLAGGVAVGTTADMMIQPVGAIMLGTIAGIVSVLGYHYLTPLLVHKAKLHDTCGVHNLHGMPGVIGAVAGIIVSAIATENDYGLSLYQIFPARAPNTTAADWSVRRSALEKEYGAIYLTPDLLEDWRKHGENRSAGVQAGMQTATLVTTLLLAIVGGTITGFVLMLKIFDPVSKEAAFDDQLNWSVKSIVGYEYEPLSSVLNETAEHEMKDVHVHEKEALHATS